MKHITLAILLSIFSASAVYFYAQRDSHFDYETCAEAAANRAKFPEALNTLMTSCAVQYSARRNTGGDGYIYKDEETGLLFQLSAPNPSSDDWASIQASIDEYKVDQEVKRLEAQQIAKQAEAVEREKAAARRKIIYAQLEKEEKERAECKARNAELIADRADAIKASKSLIRFQRRQIVTGYIMQNDGFPVSIENGSGFPIKNLQMRYQFIDLRGPYDTWNYLVCPSYPIRSWIPINERSGMRLRPFGSMLPEVNDSFVGERLLCVSLEDVTFDAPPLNLETCL
jgi:hypothetical protein